jgi:hypothetical protein
MGSMVEQKKATEPPEGTKEAGELKTASFGYVYGKGLKKQKRKKEQRHTFTPLLISLMVVYSWKKKM